MSHHEGLPDLFIDRSLGRVKVPTLLRAEGLRLVTLAERYGIPADENVIDVEWLTDAGRNGEAVLMKDERIRYNEAEKLAVKAHSVISIYREGIRQVRLADCSLISCAHSSVSGVHILTKTRPSSGMRVVNC